MIEAFYDINLVTNKSRLISRRTDILNECKFIGLSQFK